MKIDGLNFTAKDLSIALSQPITRVRYVITKLQIEPIQRVGNVGLYDYTQAEKIEQGCNYLRDKRQL